jgi:hypothetical protein
MQWSIGTESRQGSTVTPMRCWLLPMRCSDQWAGCRYPVTRPTHNGTYRRRDSRVERDPPLITRRRSVALVMVSLGRTIRVERQVVVNMMLVRLKRFGVRVPKVLWRRIIDAEARRGQSRVEWFTEDHHRVRDFVVTEIARTGEPVGVEQITATCGINKQRALAIIEELEKGMTFLFRTDRDTVDWAYPVTARRTPHRVQLDSGERFFAA